MGLGKRFSLNINKDENGNPGPGMYSNIEPESIMSRTSRSLGGSQSNKKLVFGVNRGQNDKL